jgi:hypothetical protein
MLNIRKNFFLGTSAVIFLAIAIFHGIRAYYEWEAIIGGWVVPIWISWTAALVGFIMAWTAIKLLR